jgi:predicted histone-like DNA-binding protein
MLIYKAVQSNIASKDNKKKWHPCLIKMGNVVDTQMIGETIAERSSLTAGDVHNVIRNLMAVMREQLLNSRTVKLEGLGSFTLVCQSRCKGVDEEADVSPAQITGLRCQFTPEYTRDAGGNITRALTQGASYIHVNQLTKALGAGGSGNTDGSGDDKPGGGGQEAPDPAA